MKRKVDVKTIQFNPQLFTEPDAQHRQKIINEAAIIHNFSIDQSLRSSKLSKKVSQTGQINIKNKLILEENALQKQKKNEKDRLCKSQNCKRSFSRGRQRYNQNQQARMPKSHSISRYETGMDGQQSLPQQTVRNSFQITSHSRKLFNINTDIPKDRTRTEPANTFNIKSQLMRRICKKINFMKRMTSESDPTPINITDAASISPNKSLFRFDKFYEHCVKNINRCINIYEKDVTKEKDKKYFELKVEGGILAKELKEIRNQIIQKEKQVKSDHNLGVIGSGIQVKNFEKIQSHRTNTTHYKKKVKRINKNIYEQVKNPFKMDDMHGWEFGIQRTQDFYV